MKIRTEYTDTFGGEPNYVWVKRHEETVPDDLSDLAIVRRGKKLAGLNGVPGEIYQYGDSWVFRPYRLCTVLFIDIVEERQ